MLIDSLRDQFRRTASDPQVSSAELMTTNRRISELESELSGFQRNRDLKQLFTDCSVQKRSCRTVPRVAVVSAGLPCQPWSKGGKNEGLSDSKNRGLPMWDTVEYIKSRTPGCFTLEDVKHLAGKTHRPMFDALLKAVRAAKARGGNPMYHIEFKVSNSLNRGGVPQHRARIYIVG